MHIQSLLQLNSGNLAIKTQNGMVKHTVQEKSNQLWYINFQSYVIPPKQQTSIPQVEIDLANTNQAVISQSRKTQMFCLANIEHEEITKNTLDNSLIYTSLKVCKKFILYLLSMSCSSISFITLSATSNIIYHKELLGMLW